VHDLQNYFNSISARALNARKFTEIHKKYAVVGTSKIRVRERQNMK
jgi:hypothetical protein